MKKLYILAFTIILMVLTVSGVLAQQRQIPPSSNMPFIPRSNQPAEIDPSAVTVARLHYGGGGDWYWGSSSLPNLLRFIREKSDVKVDTNLYTVQVMDDNLFKYPFLFATGHGVIKFSDEERQRLRDYLANGGFLFINDSYGMDKPVRKMIAKLFPEREFVELPFDHPIYHAYYDFNAGPPKIHEHDNKAPRGYGIIIDGRVVLYYLLESDIGDGWEDPQVHNDPESKRQEALRMGTNLVVYALTH